MLVRVMAGYHPRMMVRVLGGEDGCFVWMEGELDTANMSGYVTVLHDGGWSPVPLGQFSTPRFEGTAWFNMDDTYLAVSAEAEE